MLLRWTGMLLEKKSTLKSFFGFEIVRSLPDDFRLSLPACSSIHHRIFNFFLTFGYSCAISNGKLKPNFYLLGNKKNHGGIFLPLKRKK
jgi:hypothetical protein